MGGQAEAAGDAVGIVRSEARKIRTPLTECPDLESEEVVTPADITRRGGITRARVTQVMGMLRLPSEIREKILSMPDIVRRPSIAERMLRPIAAMGDSGDQPLSFGSSREATFRQASVFGHFGKRDPQRVRHPLAVRRIGLQAVADVADLDLLGSVAHGPCSVCEKHLLLRGAPQTEKPAGLGAIIAVLAMIPVVGSSFHSEKRFGRIRLLLPLAVTVRFVAKRAAMIAVHPHGAVAMVAVERAAGRIDRDQVVIHAEPVALGIAVGKEPPLQHLG